MSVSVALRIQDVMRMDGIVICDLPSSTIFSHKGHDFRGKKSYSTQKVFRFSLQLLSEIFLILRKIKGDMNKNAYRYSCKVHVILVRF